MLILCKNPGNFSLGISTGCSVFILNHHLVFILRKCWIVSPILFPFCFATKKSKAIFSATSHRWTWLFVWLVFVFMWTNFSWGFITFLPYFNFFQTHFIYAANISITNLTVLVIGQVHAYRKGLLAQSWEDMSQSTGRNPQNELQSPQEGYDINP